jgi:hypothetical protein
VKRKFPELGTVVSKLQQTLSVINRHGRMGPVQAVSVLAQMDIFVSIVKMVCLEML